MRTSWKWMRVIGWLAMGALLFVGSAGATGQAGFTGSTYASGLLEDDVDVLNRVILPEGVAGSAQANLWLSLQKTRGPSVLFVQTNTWEPGGTTGWHTHPGHSLIIVTQGTITAYDADCTPRTYSAGQVFVDQGGDHVHVLRNESTAEKAATVAVQLVPASERNRRRGDANAPPGCPIL